MRGRSGADGVEVVDVVSTAISVSRLEPSRDALSNDRRGALGAALRAWARLELSANMVPAISAMQETGGRQRACAEAPKCQLTYSVNQG